MKSAFFRLLAIAVFFSSCEVTEHSVYMQNTTVEASLDEAKIREAGDSKISYNSKTKENVLVYTDWLVLGMPMKNMSSANAALDDDPKPAGAAAGSQISIRGGLEYVGKGAKFPGTGSDFSINLNYLEIPIDAVYHVPAGPGVIQAGLGPYFAYGIGGSSGGVSSFGENNGGFKRFDAGLNLTAGYRFDNGLSLRLGYDLGLANVEYASEDVSGHTRTFSINVGYQIGRLFGKK